MIAAIALAENLPVYTANRDDFTGIDGLEVITVPIPEADDSRASDAAEE